MEEDVPSADTWATTELQVVHSTFEWCIKNFQYYNGKVGETLFSPTFTVGNNCDSIWGLNFYPDGETMSPDHLSLFVQLVQSYHETIVVEYRFSLLNGDREPAYKTNWSPKTEFYQNLSLGYSNFISKTFLLANMDDLLPNDTLTIFCEIKACFGKLNNASSHNKLIQPSFHSEREACSDYYKLLQSGKFSDVRLTTNGKKFNVHKGILAARSSFFENLFEQHPATENRLQIFEISNFDDAVMEEVLRYIYCGKIQNISSLGGKILDAAAKFKLKGLKDLCEEKFANSLNFKNATTLLLTAENYKAIKLKTAAVEFIASNMNTIMDTEEYKELQTTHPHLINEVVTAMVRFFISSFTVNLKKELIFPFFYVF